MNSNRTIERQERTIVRLQKNNEKLIEENRVLRLENERLSYKNALYEEAVGDIDALKNEYQTYISEAKQIRDKCKETLFSMRKLQKENKKKVHQLDKQFKI